jgi:hypothetical protein
MGREKKEEEEQKKENRTECDSNELTIYKEEIDDRSYTFLFFLVFFFLKFIEERKKAKKNDNIDILFI